MTLNTPDDQNEAVRAAERELRFNETAQIAAERELEARINERLGHTARLYNLAVLATVVVMLVAVTYWIFNVNGKPAQPKVVTTIIPADFSNNLQVAKQQLLEFQTAYAETTNRLARQKGMDAQIDSQMTARATRLKAMDAEIDSQTTSRAARLKAIDAEIDSQMTSRAARLKAIDAEIDSQATSRAARLKAIDAEIDSQVTNRLMKMDAQIDAEVTARISRLKEVEAQIAGLSIPTNFQQLDLNVQNYENIRSNSEAIFSNVSELNDYFVALTSLRPDENNRINRTALDPLRHIADNKNHSLSQNARADLRTLANGLESERQIFLTVGPSMPFNTNTITFDQTVSILKRQTDPYRVIKLLTFISNNTNFPKGQQMNLMMDTYLHSTNLIEVYVAELAIKSEARLANLEPFSFDQVQDWWRTHQSSYR